MTDPAYPPARTVSPRVEQIFATRQAEARQQGLGVTAPEIHHSVVEELIEVGFWSSIRREEGRSPKISFAYIPPELAGEALFFARPLSLNADALTHLAPAVERPGIHLGVWGKAGDLRVWGSTRALPHLCFVLEVVAPGLLVVKYSREEAFSKFGNVAVIEGDRVKVIDETKITRADCPRMLAVLTGMNPTDSRLDSTHVLVELALSMRAHEHGGTLLVVPADSDRWEKSIVLPISYRMAPAFTRLADLVRLEQRIIDGMDWRQSFRQTIDTISGLTAVDGATLIDDRYDLLAFGAKIDRMEGSTTVRQVILMEPVDGHIPERINAAEIGGTRHLSAAQFVHDQRDAIALVASQDGHFTIFAWSDKDERVQAHRIEAMLL